MPKHSRKFPKQSRINTNESRKFPKGPPAYTLNVQKRKVNPIKVEASFCVPRCLSKVRRTMARTVLQPLWRVTKQNKSFGFDIVFDCVLVSGECECPLQNYVFSAHITAQEPCVLSALKCEKTSVKTLGRTFRARPNFEGFSLSLEKVH